MRRKTRPISLVSLLMLLVAIPTLGLAAQIEDSLDHYTGENAKGYLNPLKEGFGGALQAGMYRSAAIPKTGFQIDLDVKIGMVKFGDSDKTFTAKAESGFVGPTDTAKAPTVVGSENAVTLVGDGGAQFVFPGGLNMSSIGVPVPQLTVSGLMGSQLLVRWISIKTGDSDVGDIKLFGIGVRHSISQYIPACPVDIAAGGTWQSLKVGSNLIDSHGLSIGAQASKKYSVLEPYAGIAIDRFSMSVDYDYKSGGGETVPIHVDLGSNSNAHLSGGLGINLGLLHLYGEVGTAGRTILSTGFSVGN